jgi:hypothetical protein
MGVDTIIIKFNKTQRDFKKNIKKKLIFLYKNSVTSKHYCGRYGMEVHDINKLVRHMQFPNFRSESLLL